MDTFDLKETQLLPIGASIYGASIHSCRIEGRVPLNQGGCGDKAMCDLVLTTVEGHEISIPLFLKKFSWKGRSEAAHYRQLTQCGVPTPHLYGAIMHPDGDEILFLERLTQLGFDRSNEAEWRQLLTLLARFNACDVTPNYLEMATYAIQLFRLAAFYVRGRNANPDGGVWIAHAHRRYGATVGRAGQL